MIYKATERTQLTFRVNPPLFLLFYNQWAKNVYHTAEPFSYNPFTIGNTFTEYLNFVRICKAEHMLRSGSSISDAAYVVGFSSLSYFNRVFKKYKFCSPSDYKKISKQREGFEF